MPVEVGTVLPRYTGWTPWSRVFSANQSKNAPGKIEDRLMTTKEYLI